MIASRYRRINIFVMRHDRLCHSLTRENISKYMLFRVMFQLGVEYENL